MASSVLMVVASLFALSSGGCAGKVSGSDAGSTEPTGTGGARPSDTPDSGGGTPAGGTLEDREATICSIMMTHGYVDDAVVQTLLGQSASCILRATDYDRSCKSDSDCVWVGDGDACSAPCRPGCENATISLSALLLYQADRDRTPLGYCAVGCGCPVEFDIPRCVSGTCTLVAGGLRVEYDGGGP